MANGPRWARIVSLLLGVFSIASPSFAGPLDPMQFQSLGSLSLSGPIPFTVNSIGPNPTLLAGGNTYNGVVFNGIAVFDFDSVSIASGATLMSTGGAPVALLSRTTELISGTINFSALGTNAGAGASNTGVGQNGISYGQLGATGSGYSARVAGVSVAAAARALLA